MATISNAIETSQQAIDEVVTLSEHLGFFGYTRTQIEAYAVKEALVITAGKPQLISELRKRWAHRGSETGNNRWGLDRIASALGF